MTATSPTNRRFMRLTSMESLGFIDTPLVRWTTPPIAPLADPDLTPETTQTTELVPIPVGRHSRHAEPTGELVKDMWDSTELHAPSLIDWAPQAFSAMKLGRRDFRWPVVLMVLAGLVAAAGFGYWFFAKPGTAAGSVRAQLQTQASTLAGTFDEASPLIADLDADRLPQANLDSTVFFDMGEAARTMFASSAGLPASDSVDRSAAADAAGLALDASRQLMDATAYRTALEPALNLPLLETDPGLTDLVTATAAFSEWRSGFEAVRSALPTGVTGQASPALDALSARLETTQSAYLDALRTQDRAAAVEVIGTLRAELQQVRHALLLDMEDISVSVSSVIEQAETRLAELLS